MFWYYMINRDSPLLKNTGIIAETCFRLLDIFHVAVYNIIMYCIHYIVICCNSEFLKHV